MRAQGPGSHPHQGIGASGNAAELCATRNTGISRAINDEKIRTLPRRVRPVRVESGILGAGIKQVLIFSGWIFP